MPKSRLPYTLHEKNRHGTWSWYFRRDKKSKRIKINGEYGSEQFMAEYAVAASGIPSVPKRQASAKGSLSWLVMQWKQSSDWAVTKPATKRQRENILLHILDGNGALPFAQVDELAIMGGRERRSTKPSAANNYLKTMRALFGWAAEMKHVKTNPAAGVKFIPNKSDGHEPWTIADVEAYRKRWAIGSRQRLAFEILFWTGLRRGDACRFGPQHIDRNGMAFIRMEKTENPVAFMVPEQLSSVISATVHGDMAFITTESGKPFSKEGFGNVFREWARAAGVKKSAHGIRKFAASDAAEKGATEAELNAMFGWQSNNQSLVYTRAARGSQMATEGISKRGGNMKSANPLLQSANPKKQAKKST